MKKSYDQLRQHIKNQRYYLASKGPYSQSYGFSSSDVWMWDLDYKESWLPKNWCFWNMVLEKTLESPLDSLRVSDPTKVIQPVHSKGNQSWIFTGRTDAEAETPNLWPPNGKNWLTGKDPDAGKDWGQEEMGTTEDEVFGWHHCLDGHEFEQGPGVGDGQGGLACCSPWVAKSDTTERLDWTELNCACQSWVRAAEGDDNPQAFPAFLDSRGGSGTQRAQSTKRHGCRLLKIKASPHRGVVCETGETVGGDLGRALLWAAG